jgi:hypothetical protein
MNDDCDWNSPMESNQFVMNRVVVIIVAASTNKDAHEGFPSFGHFVSHAADAEGGREIDRESFNRNK